jgi:hypothetical protein
MSLSQSLSLPSQVSGLHFVPGGCDGLPAATGNTNIMDIIMLAITMNAIAL